MYGAINTLNEFEKICAFTTAKSLVTDIEEGLEERGFVGRAYAIEKLMVSLIDLKKVALPGATTEDAKIALSEALYNLERFVELVSEELQ